MNKFLKEFKDRGYFNTNPDKIVCYPNKWINIPNSLEDLFPKEWKQIST